MNRAALLSLLFCLLLAACQPEPPAEAPPARVPVRDAVLAYLARPDFVHPEFAEQALGPGVFFLGFDRNADRVFFAARREGWREHAARLCADSSQLGRDLPAYRWMPDESFPVEDSAYACFAFPRSAFQVDSSRVLERKLGNYTFRLTLGELREYYSAASLFNAPALFLDTAGRPRPLAIGNHAAPIALPGTPSLQALAAAVADSQLSPEAQAQQLLDFVTNEIRYQSHGRYEIFMKPHEVLLTGRSDCSGKVVLYSSLLQQIGLPHLLVYLPSHICVGLPGRYAEENGMAFTHEGQRYSFAETTLPGYQIGRSETEPSLPPDSIQYLQVPGKSTRLYSLRSRDSLAFAVKLVEVN
jgi:hypothetical protein